MRFRPIRTAAPFAGYRILKRFVYELEYSWRLMWRLRAEQADVVVFTNTPLVILWLVQRALPRRTATVLWHQDLLSLAMSDEIARRAPGRVADVVRHVLEGMEISCVRRSTAVVAIGDAFANAYRDWGLECSPTVIPNWAPLDEIAPMRRNNTWCVQAGLPAERVRILYSGTLGRKHNPVLLLELLSQVRALGVDAHLTVVSEGEGIDAIRQSELYGPEVALIPFQPIERLSEVLASADLLVALLEPNASSFSIPSKVLSYLAAGRPVLGLMPEDNPAADSIVGAGGFVASPDQAGIETAAKWILDNCDDPDWVDVTGARARALAEQEFNIEHIVGRFEAVFARATNRDSPSRT